MKISPHVRVRGECTAQEIHELASLRPPNIKDRNVDRFTAPRKVLVDSLRLDWSNMDFTARRLDFHRKINKFLSQKTQERLELNQQLAPFLWARTLKYAHLLHLPDCVVHPETRVTVVPRDGEHAQNLGEEGYIPLAVGDGYRYRTIGLPGTEHRGIYLGLGYGGHLVVDNTGDKRLGKVGLIVVESLQSMFARTALEFTKHEECATKLDRVEVVRRVLSTATEQVSRGCYSYSLRNFNCQTAVLGWRDEPPPDTTWADVLFWIAIGLSVVLVIILIIFLSLTLTSPSPKYIKRTTTTISKTNT